MIKKANTIKQQDTWVSKSHDQQMVMTYYDQLRSVLPASTSVKDFDAIERAFELSLKSHAGIRRKSGEPFIIHPLRVALIVANEIGLGPTSIVSAILHDVVEDTSVSLNQVRKLFGSGVYRIVRGLTKIKKMVIGNKSMQAENFKKLLLNGSEDYRIILVKLADRIDNMRYLYGLPRHKQLRMAAETQQIYAPLAHRAGLNRVKAELENLYLVYTHPEAFAQITEKISMAQKERALQLETISEAIESALKKQGYKFKIEKRIKSIYSIWHKITHKKIPFDQIYDLFALRIILDCDRKDEKAYCWHTYGIVSNMYPSNTSRLRDSISNPKSNGYESLHATLMSPSGDWIEIQIRTTRMHEIAEKGIAAHWEYKKDAATGEGMIRLEKWLLEVRELLEEEKYDSINLIEDFKLSLYDDEIVVFNKEGSLTILPKGATVLDFAIETLDEKGLTCSGAIIGKRFLPVNYVLQNTEQVDLVLSPNQKISNHWVNLAQTAKGRKVVKKYFRRAYFSTLEKGKQILRNALQSIGMYLNKEIEMALSDLLNEKTVEKTYYKIGSESISEDTLASAIKLLAKIRDNKNDRLPNINIQIKEDIVVTGDNDPSYELASCCLPIANEEIFGVMGMNKIKIHRVNCLQAPTILSTQGAKIVKARWKRGMIEGFLVFLEIEALNRKNMTKDIINSIKKDVHIESIAFLDQKNHIKGNLTIEVENAKKLNQMMERIEKIQGVLAAKRVQAT